MKLITLLIAIVSLSTFEASAQQTLTQEKLINLDGLWEKAQLELDHDFIESLLAKDFIWVHNHAGTIDNKAAVLERIKRYIKTKNQSTRSRRSKDVKVIISGTTAVVHGFTIIDRGPSPITYHFMRTYVQSDGNYFLLANHTMAVPDKE